MAISAAVEAEAFELRCRAVGLDPAKANEAVRELASATSATLAEARRTVFYKFLERS